MTRQKKCEPLVFHVQKVKGNDEEAIDEAIDCAKGVKDQAVCIVLDSIKGSGVPYFEQLEGNHSVKFNNDEILNANHEAVKALESFIEGGSAPCID